jgi:hypothetical protein
MSIGDDDVAHFESPSDADPSNYALRAAWGPLRWRVGSYVSDVAYAPDGESIWFVSSNTVVRLDRQGRPVAALRTFEARSIELSRDGRRVAVLHERGPVTIVELESMREIFRVEAKPGTAHLFGPRLSGDGAVLAIGPVVYRVGEEAPIATEASKRFAHTTSSFRGTADSAGRAQSTHRATSARSSFRRTRNSYRNG